MISTESAAIGSRIRKRMKAQNLTQHQLAERLGVTRSTINNYLRGACRVSGPVLKNMARHLDTTTDFLLGDEGESAASRTPATKADIERIMALLQNNL